ncbi:hypothetical protein AHV85_22240 [Salmonella enterica]|nr:hypothetical protein [Salmonella enterica]
MINENDFRDGILFIDSDNPSESIIFNLKSWIGIIEAIIEKYAGKTKEESKKMVSSSLIVKNMEIKNYNDVAFYCHESEYYWAMLIAYGEQYWLKGISPHEPVGYFEWAEQYRRRHNLAAESFVFSD